MFLGSIESEREDTSLHNDPEAPGYGWGQPPQTETELMFFFIINFGDNIMYFLWSYGRHF